MMETRDVEEIFRIVLDCGYKVHKEFGPGLLEAVYETVLASVLVDAGLSVERQVAVPIVYRDVRIENAFRADLVIQNKFVAELKSTEHINPVHGKQLLTYLRLMKFDLGILINFGMYSYKEGVKRVANNYYRPM